MLDKKDIQEIKNLLKPLATKEDLKDFATKKDLKDEIKKEIDGLAVMINKSFNETEKRMAEGFKTLNEKIDKKVDKIDKRVIVIEEALAIK